jgi:hypothetical protein
MKKRRYLPVFLILLGIIPFLAAFAGTNGFPGKRKSTKNPELIYTNQQGRGYEMEISFVPGRHHNHPLMAFWIEDTLGQYVQCLYVAQSIAKGNFGHGDASTGRWQPGPLRRPAALPLYSIPGKSHA